MKKIMLVSFVGLMTSVAFAQPRPSLVAAEKTELKAVVQDIDQSKREVTLKGPEGRTVKLKVGDQARNLDQVKKGDEVVATFYESVALSLAKKGEAPTGIAEGETVRLAEKGQKPAGIAAATKRMTATVEKIDRAKREVTLKGPEGNKAKLKVDESVGDLSRIKEGDEIVATYTAALAVSVRKPNQ